MNNKEWKNNNNNNNIYVFHFALHLSLSDKPKKGERDGRLGHGWRKKKAQEGNHGRSSMEGKKEK